MRRIAMALCVLALLCQMLVFPVYAEPATEGTTGADTTITTGTTSKDGTYDRYVETNPEGLAPSAIEIKGSAAAQMDATVTVKDNALLFSNQNGKATWNVNVPAAGWYAVAFTYQGVEGGSSDMELGLQIDGKTPYHEAERFVLPRLWVNDGETRQDSNGNQFAPEQKEEYAVQKKPLRDVNGFVSEDLNVYLTAGAHTITLSSYGEALVLHKIHLDVPQVLLPMKEQLEAWKNAGINNYTGTEQRVVEGEDSINKTDRSVIGQSDNSTPGVQPADPYIRKVNFIGGANWSMTDEAITWQVEAPETGIYKVGFHFRQNFLVNASSYRSLKVNGVHQYAEQMALGFYYANGWQFNDKLMGGETVLVKLDKGINTITLTVTLGDMDAFSAKMENVTLRLGEMYRDIIGIIGETPDANRDYDLFQRVPDLADRMNQLHAEMEAMIEERKDEDGNIDDIAALLQKMNVVLERMLKKQYQAQTYKSNYYDCYSSLSAQLQEMKNMALDLDCMVIAAPDAAEYVRSTAGFFQKLWFDVERFIASFILDYNTAAGVQGENTTPLTIWVNWSRDQTLVLNSLINGHFSAENPDISVTVRMTNASLLQGIMSNNAPDCSLSDSRTTPVNLAMRGALVDLKKEFSAANYNGAVTYEDAMSWFVKGSEMPYVYNNGVYALPSTQQFYMLFYRTDIFEDYGLVDENGKAKPPKTWDEFVEYASILMLNNMEVGLPYTELTDIGQVNGGVASLNIFPTLLMQKNLSLYNEDRTGTSFASVETMTVFQEWTDYYTKYNLPKTYNFFNRFRIGLVPMAIQGYGQYSALSAAAPEIKGLWEMAEIPGVLQADGTINNSQAGYGSACMILDQSEHPEAAWKLLTWWMRADTQRRYALDIESILGVAGRYSSANVEATTGLDWGKDASNTLRDQWNKVIEIEEIPGGYYVSRAVDQAFWNVLTMNENPKDMMKKWGEVADVEIQTKIEQYKDDRKEGNE